MELAMVVIPSMYKPLKNRNSILGNVVIPKIQAQKINLFKGAWSSPGSRDQPSLT